MEALFTDVLTHCVFTLKGLLGSGVWLGKVGCFSQMVTAESSLANTWGGFSRGCKEDLTCATFLASRVHWQLTRVSCRRPFLIVSAVVWPCFSVCLHLASSSGS